MGSLDMTDYRNYINVIHTQVSAKYSHTFNTLY